MSSRSYEVSWPLSSPTYRFVGRKPVAVSFDGERIEVKSWREVYSVILSRCNENPVYHDMLMYLRNKVLGKCRVFLSDSPAGMIRPWRIDEGLYGETHYGSATLMHILTVRILAPTGFDISDIEVVIKAN